jgi:Protein of unknown function (DUF2842)
MSQRTRKLFGTIALLVILTVYSLVVAVLATYVFPRLTTWQVPVFYAIAGLGWVPLAMVVVSWMYRGRAETAE